MIALALIAEPTEGSLNVQAVKKDPDDVKYLVAALEGRAGYLVSGDSDLLELHEYRGCAWSQPMSSSASLRKPEHRGQSCEVGLRWFPKTGTGDTPKPPRSIHA